MAILGFEIEEVEKLVALVEEQELDELIIEENGRTLRIRGAKHVRASASKKASATTEVAASQNLPVPVLAKAISPKRSAEALAVPKADQVALDSPMVGIFYRSPKPGSPSFIEVGQYVSVGQIIGMIEAMKTFSNVEAEHSGTVVSFPAKDGELVQMGKPLAILKRD